MITVIVISVILILFFLYAHFIGASRLRIREYYFKDLPCDMILISDLHFRRYSGIHRRVYDVLRAYKGIETVICSGDTFENIGNYEFFDCLEEKDGYFVLGNNDYGKKNEKERVDKIEKIFKKRGIRILRNENIKISENFYVVGIDDPHKEKEDLEKSFDGIPGGAKVFSVVHSPEANDGILEYEPDYLFFGHTHGGQVRFPFIGSVFNNIRRGKVPPLGICRRGKTTLIHSSGIGTTLLPIRFMNPAEVIVLRRSDAEHHGHK